MSDQLSEKLRGWVDAGLIAEAQASAIAAHEAQRSGAGARRVAGERVGGTEALTYAGVAAVIAGVLYLVFTAAADATQAAVLSAMAVAAALAGAAFARSGTLSSARAADACLAVAAGLGGAAAGQLLALAGWLSSTTIVAEELQGATLVPLTTTDHSGDVVAAAAVSLAIAAGALARLGRSLCAYTAAAAVYTAAMVLADHASGEGTAALAIAACAAGAVILAAAELACRGTPRLVRSVEPLRFFALVVPLTVLLVTDPGDRLGAGGVIAGLLAAAAIAAAVQVDSNALVLAGGVGLFGFCVATAAREYHGEGRVTMVLVVGGVSLVACAALVQWGMRRTRARPGLAARIRPAP